MTEPSRKRLPIRWLTLGEIVGVAALLLAGLGYWDTHRERVAADQAHRAELAQQAAKLTFLMTGQVADHGGAVRLTSVHPEQVIQTQTVWFPRTLRAGSVETTGNPRIEAGWIEEAVRKTAGSVKHGRLPVAVQTVYIQDGQTKTDNAVYEVGYTLHPRLILGDKLDLEGVFVARRGVSGDLQAAAGQMWGRK